MKNVEYIDIQEIPDDNLINITGGINYPTGKIANFIIKIMGLLNEYSII